MHMKEWEQERLELKKKKRKKGKDAKLMKLENQAPHYHVYCLSQYKLKKKKSLTLNEYKWWGRLWLRR